VRPARLSAGVRPRMQQSPILLASAALVGFWLVELILRESPSARSWSPGAADRGSTPAIIAAYVLVAVCLTARVGGPQLPLFSRWFGACLAVAGLVLRVVAFRTLGSSYSRTLRVTESQALVTDGVYRVIRHPGYASALCVWVGAAVASGPLWAAIAVAALLLAVYAYRIRAEEVMLLQAFGTEYQQYQARSWRLLPFVY